MKKINIPATYTVSNGEVVREKARVIMVDKELHDFYTYMFN